MKIRVTKSFVLTLVAGVTRTFAEGEHVVEQAIADHWYVKAHSAPTPAETQAVPKPAPAPKKSK